MNTNCPRRFLWFGLFFGLAVVPLAGQQQHAIDSLKVLLQQHPQRDSVRGELLFELVKLQLGGSNEDLSALARELMELGTETGSPLMKFRAYNLLGIVHARPGVYLADALLYYDSAIEIATAQPGEEWRIREAKTLFNVAGIQMMSGQFEATLRAARRSFELFKSFNDTLAMADTYRAMGQAFIETQQPDSALACIQVAIGWYKIKNARLKLPPAYLDLVETYRQVGALDRALFALQACGQYLDTTAAPGDKLDWLRQFGIIYKDMARWKESESCLRQALELSTAMKLLLSEENIHADLADLFERTSRLDSALFHFKQYQTLKEQRLNTERNSQLAELQTRFRVKESEQDNALLRTEKRLLQKQKEVTWWSFLAIILVLAGIAWYIRKIVRRSLLEKTEELRAFNYSVGHDLRAPLQNARHWLELLRNDVAHNRAADIQNDLQYVGQSMDQLQEMLEGMLRWFTADQNAPLYSAVAVQPLVENIWQQCRQRYPAVPAVLYARDLPVVQADKLMLRQVFENLIANALKFTAKKENPEIRVTVEESSDTWKFEVIDNGAGFAPDRQAMLFELFKTAHSRDQYPGSGIGLALVKRLLEKMGGDITAQSPGPGEGAAFTFTLPKKN